jgi:hypothetical protein
MSLASFIAKTGTNPYFIAFNAHCWSAYALVVTVPWHVTAALAVAALAAVKEFWFDATYEVPKQTSLDNLTDWVGYAAGAVLAVVAARS